MLALPPNRLLLRPVSINLTHHQNLMPKISAVITTVLSSAIATCITSNIATANTQILHQSQ
jgi:hypothetical protein